MNPEKSTPRRYRKVVITIRFKARRATDDPAILRAVRAAMAQAVATIPAR